MKTSEMIEKLYLKMKKEHGDIAAREFISSMIFNIIVDCQESGNQKIADAIDKTVKEDFDIFIKRKAA
ncbi:MAG: hypothetical protein WD025_06790 [Bacteriovoracaceae bacterium]